MSRFSLPAGFTGADFKAVLERGATLPPACYTDPGFYQWEVESLLRPGWHCVGRADGLPEPGDFQALDLAGVPLVLVRGDDGELRCLSNVCRHRAMTLLQDQGRCDLIRCPFHGWSYRLNGSLAGAPSMNRAASFDKSHYALPAVRVAELDGLVFINLDGEAPPLGEALAGFGALHAPHAFADMRLARRKRYVVACNWKLFIQVFMEYYHLEYVHPATLAETAYQPPGPDDAAFTAGFASVFGLHQGTGAVLQQGDVQTFPRIQTLDERLAGGTRYSHVFPALALAATRDCMWFFECYPQGPARSVFYMNNCFPAATLARDDFDRVARGYYERWDTALAEDIEILERQQVGMASPLARAGASSHLESAVGHFERWMATRALAALEPRDYPVSA